MGIGCDRRAFGKWLVISVLIATIASLPSSVLAQVGSITGVVQDRTTGEGIAGASVSVAGKSAKADAEGNYTVSNVPVGTQTLTGSANMYTRATVSATVVEGQTVTAPVLRLGQNFGSISGRVINSVTQTPVSGVSLTVSGATATAVTDSTGSYTMDRVLKGVRTVTASLSGYESASVRVDVTVGGSAAANFALTSLEVPPPPPTNGIQWNGTRSYLLGANFAWYNYGTDFGTGGWNKFTNWTTINNNFATMRNQGVRVVRWWVFADGRYAPDFKSDGTVSGLDTHVLPDVGRALKAAADNNIYLLFVVMDSSMWSKASTSGSVTMGGHSNLVTNATVQQTFLDNAMKPLLQYVAASPYKSYALGYDIVNEPEANMDGYWGGTKLQPTQVKTFVKRCTEYVHAFGGGALATVGCATPYYIGTWKNLGLDFYQIHYYPWMDFNREPGSGLPTYASLNLDRPCIVGEFPSASASYGLEDTNSRSARWYLDSIFDKGYAGALAWSFRVDDAAASWKSFQPVFTFWADRHLDVTGPK